MIINIRKSKLFTEKPSKRFALTNDVPPRLFDELWTRYSTMGYSVPELCIYFHIKNGVPINTRKMNEWMFRQKVYLKAQEYLKYGAQAVNSEVFGDLEERLLSKLTEHMRYRETKNIRVLV